MIIEGNERDSNTDFDFGNYFFTYSILGRLFLYIESEEEILNPNFDDFDHNNFNFSLDNEPNCRDSHSGAMQNHNTEVNYNNGVEESNVFEEEHLEDGEQDSDNNEEEVAKENEEVVRENEEEAIGENEEDAAENDDEEFNKEVDRDGIHCFLNNTLTLKSQCCCFR